MNKQEELKMFLLIYGYKVREIRAKNWEHAHVLAINHIVEWHGEESTGEPPADHEIDDNDIILYEILSEKQFVDLYSYREKWEENEKQKKQKTLEYKEREELKRLKAKYDND